MPYTNLCFDVTFPGLGRIQRSSGTEKKAIFKQMVAMLYTLYSSGHLDKLEQIRDGKLKPMEVFDAFRRGHLEELPTADGMRSLSAELTKWRENGAWSAWHTKGLAACTKRVLAGLPDNASVADLQPRLQELRVEMVKKARTFNQIRTMAQAFLRDTTTKASPLYRNLQAISPLPYRPKTPHRPQSPKALAALEVDSDTRSIALSMAASGMGPKEFWEDGWERIDGRILVHGEKDGERGRRDRFVPDIGVVTTPTMSREAFRQRIKRAGVGFTPYDMRRTFANWCESALIPRTRRRLYMGHSSGDITDMYERHEISEFLAGDAKLLKDWYDAQMSA